MHSQRERIISATLKELGIGKRLVKGRLIFSLENHLAGMSEMKASNVGIHAISGTGDACAVIDVRKFLLHSYENEEFTADDMLTVLSTGPYGRKIESFINRLELLHGLFVEQVSHAIAIPLTMYQ